MSEKQTDARIVLIGAGSVSFGLSTLGDLMTVGYENLNGATIVLHDISEPNLKRMTGVLKLALKEAGEDGDLVPYKVESTINPKEALQDANYVVMSIEHGNRMETWKQDYYIPRKHGSRQIYGENGGPGGAFHTWRQVPPMLKICRTMEDLCPDAWLLNYSNPVPRVTWALKRVSKIKTIGLCHGVLSGVNGLISILGTSRKNLDFISAGLNHFYWFIKVTAKRDFKLPAFDHHPEEEIKAGTDMVPYIRKRGITWAKQGEKSLLEEIFRLYGYLTYPSQSHPGEYIPWADSYCPYVKYNFSGYAAGGEREKEKLNRTLAGDEMNYWWVHPSGERAIYIIDALEHDKNQYELAVNVENGGAINNLRSDCVAEVPAYVDKSGIHPIDVGVFPDGIAQLLQSEVAIQDLVSKAAVTGDRETAIQALSLDGTVPNPESARAMFNEMLKLQKDLLPQFRP
ncbi:MAG: hypothetical protein GF364_12270 [Candidatus Lokiarchaeota archaeon]|nr:hypothetical protein [Candidatus Lokiarchaeota archaeon]